MEATTVLIKLSLCLHQELVSSAAIIFNVSIFQQIPERERDFPRESVSQSVYLYTRIH